MDPKYAAELFLSWAYSEGLTGLESPPPAVPLPLLPHPLSGVTHEGKALLREKLVQAVAANSADHEILVFLRKVAPRAKKALAKLPAFIDDVAVKYTQGITNPIDAQAPASFGGPPYALKQFQSTSYYTCGSSISVGNFREAGTLGALVRDAQGRLYGLSNSHVVAGCNHAPLKMPIVAPGVLDVTPQNYPPFTLGAYSSSLPLVPGSPDTVAWQNNADLAYFEISNGALISSSQQNFYDTPATVSPLAAGLSVEKVGRTTGHTHGRVKGMMTGHFGIPYHASVYDFRGIVYQPSVFVVEGIGKAFSEGGDSGSLVVHSNAQGVKTAVGIVFAGMQSNEAPGNWYSLVLPLQPLLLRTGLQLVSGHNA